MWGQFYNNRQEDAQELLQQILSMDASPRLCNLFQRQACVTHALRLQDSGLRSAGDPDDQRLEMFELEECAGAYLVVDVALQSFG